MAKSMSRSGRTEVALPEALENLYGGMLPGFFSPMLGRQQAHRQFAPIDIEDHDDAFILKAELPGVAKDMLDIQVHGNQVYISAKKEEESSSENKQFIHQERSYGEFSRTVQLPADVNPDLTKATFKDGVLELHLPKTESAKRKTIKIS
jgi:HSP20 family protein